MGQDKIIKLGFTKYLVHQDQTSYKKEVTNDGLTHIAIVTTKGKDNYTFSVHLKGGSSSLIKPDCSFKIIRELLKMLF